MTPSQPGAPPNVLLPEVFDSGALIRELVDRGGLHAFIKLFWSECVPQKFSDNWHLGALSEYLEAVTLGQLTRLAINVPPGTGKPVDVREPVWTRRGYIPLSDVVVGDEVLTHTGSWQRVEEVHEQGELPILRIETFSGRSVRVAPDHPMLTPRGWVQAQHLTTEDTLGLVIEQSDELPELVTPAQARLCGYLVGDGCMTHGMPMFTNQEPDAIEDFCVVVAEQGWSTHISAKRGNAARAIRIQCSRTSRGECRTLKPGVGKAGRPKGIKNGEGKSLDARRKRGEVDSLNCTSPCRQWFQSVGLDRKSSYTKRIPPQILNGSKRILEHFIGAYWTCDGTITNRSDGPKRRGRAWRADCTTVSEGLAADLLVAFQRLGMKAHLRTKIANIKTKRQGETYRSFKIEICGQDSLAKLVSLPGLCARKRREYSRSEFDAILLPERITNIVPEPPSRCRCLTVEIDHSFTASGFAVKNSLTCGVFWPAWFWTIDPKTSFLSGSFDQSLLNGQSEKLISVLECPKYKGAYPYIQLKKKKPALREFSLTEGGFRFNTSPEGRGTGRHVDGLLIDDPMKPQDAILQRELAFQKVNTWFDGTLQTRVRKWIVVIMQRVHTDDLAGRCLAEGYEPLILPMRQVKRTMWARDPRKEVGELLWPALFPEERVRQQELKLRNEASAQLQQDPTPASGGFIEEPWTRLEWIEPPKKGVWIQSWDFSSKGALESHSKVSGQLWCCTRDMDLVREFISDLSDRLAKVPGSSTDARIKHLPERQESYVLVDWVGGHWNFVASKAQFTMAQARPNWNRARIKLIELKANGPAIIDEMHKRFPGIKGVEPEGTKEERLRVHTEKFEAGQVIFPPGIGDAVREELVKFPRFTWDDHVDTCTQALDRFANSSQRYREAIAKIANRTGS